MVAHLRAHVVGYLALFVALSGTAYAATLPRNSVGTQQLRTGAVRSSDVRDRAIQARDLAPGVLRAGPAGATGATGPAGPQGDAGPQGPAGPTDGASASLTPQPAALEPLTGSPVTVTTAKAGRLFATLVITGVDVDCQDASSGARLVLRVDGTVVPGSTMQLDVDPNKRASLEGTVLTGVTAGSLPAGPHEVDFGLDCVGAGFSAVSITKTSSASVVVLGP